VGAGQPHCLGVVTHLEQRVDISFPKGTKYDELARQRRLERKVIHTDSVPVER